MTGSPELPRPRLAVLAAGLYLVAGGLAADTAIPPARRIVSLAPHLTELTFAAGAGNRLVGVVEFSDHPAGAQRIPRIGDAFRLDLEAIAAVRPDLILGWPSGNSMPALDRLRRLGYRVVDLEPRGLEDLGSQIVAIGDLAGTGDTARVAGQTWVEGLDALRNRFRDSAPVRVFYQIAPEPLITVNGAHFIGQAIDLCGGRNIFAGVPGLTPVVSTEAVIAAAPDVIVASDFTRGSATIGNRKSPLDVWRSWPSLSAVASGRLYVIDPDLMSVPGPRLLQGIAALCVDIAG